MDISAQTPAKPKGGQGNTDWAAYVRLMKEQPNEWFNCGNFSPGIPYAIRMGKYRDFLDPDSPLEPEQQMKKSWEVTARTTGPSQRCDVFIRYVNG